MSHRADRPLTLLLATATACLAAAGAQAQVAAPGPSATGSAPRYVSWANRPVGTVPADVAATRAQARGGVIPRRVAPSQAVSRPTMQAPAAPVSVSRGLTPASAWLGPRTAPAFAPGTPDPLAHAMAEAPAAPPPVAQPAPAPVEAGPAADPMAPRRDAPIFRLQPQGQAQDQAQGQASVQSGNAGARYYSVHRDAGRQPDPTALPEPVYFDSVSLDLAEPPASEAPIGQGRRAVVANEDPSLP